jgi:hypothetical protein
MINVGLVPFIMDRSCEALRQTTLTIDTTSKESPKVGGQGAPLDIRTKSLAGDRRKTQWFWARIEHK